MQLQLENDTIIKNPNPDEIEKALMTLNEDDNSWAILEISDSLFVQTSNGYSTEGYILEYQEGSIDRHYQTGDFNIPLEKIIQVFKACILGDYSWKKDFKWHKEEF